MYAYSVHLDFRGTLSHPYIPSLHCRRTTVRANGIRLFSTFTAAFVYIILQIFPVIYVGKCIFITYTRQKCIYQR